MTSTVIIGAGVIGCASAYYLSQDNPAEADSITILEAANEPFQCASGLAAGFLAADWFGSAVAPLGSLSFKLHKELAEQYNGRAKWGYSKSTSTSLVQESDASGERGDDWLRQGGSRAQTAAYDFIEGGGPSWLSISKGSRIEVIAEDETTAQVDPLKLSTFLLNQAVSRGVKLYKSAKITSIVADDNGCIVAVKVSVDGASEISIPCSRLLITAGPWTSSVFSSIFPKSHLTLPITSLSGYSLLIRSPRWTKTENDDIKTSTCHSVFATDGHGFSPEIFSRLGGEIYIAGLNSSSTPLPAPGAKVEFKTKDLGKLHDVASRLLGIDGRADDLETLREGLCFRPVTDTGRPIISRISDENLGGGLKTKGGHLGGVFVSAGHGPWGISMSLGTGKVLSELMRDTTTSADVRGLAV